jgi:hypothetical protein
MFVTTYDLICDYTQNSTSLGPQSETPPGETLTEETPLGEIPSGGLPGLVCDDGSVPSLSGFAFDWESITHYEYTTKYLIN